MEAEVAESTNEYGLTAAEARIRAMSHPIRARILRHYIEHGEKAPVEVHHELRIELSKCSYHCRELAKLGCLELVRTEQVRGSTKHYFVATERHLVDKPEWEELDPLDREGVLTRVMQPLIDDFLKAMRDGTLGGESGDFHLTRIPVKSVDREGFEELLAAHMALYERTYEIEMRAAARMAESGEEPMAVSTGQTCFPMLGF